MSKTKLNELVTLLGGEQLQSLVETVSRQKDPLTEPAKTKKYRQLDIAIIGLSGRYPRADHHYEFWKKLQQGANFLQEVPVSRWNHSDYYDPHIKGSPVPGKTRCKFGAFLNAYDQFDASFFDLDIAEITIMDPQERLALETTWSCIEDAGYVPAALAKEVGIFSGVTYSEYQKLIHVPSHACMLNSRIAYFFNFQGPSITTDAGCSSSLTAIHLACQSLTRKECRTAIVIGANLILHPGHYTGISSMLSPTTQPYSNPFGTDDGWIPAEGVVSILLKPLSRALQDRDHIYGVIKSSHIRQEGKTSWFTAFNPKQQARLIRENFEKSGIHPETISYVEAAANGSALGDAIELEGLTAAFGHFTAKKQFCPLGTVKSRVGHGEAASTLLQLTNVLLQFKSKTLFPLAHLKEKNPNIRIEDSPFYFQDSPQKWEPPYINLEGKRFTMPRRAAISSFATGGHMGHLILEEHVPVNRQKQTPDSYFIPISAKTAAQLRETIENFIKFFKEYPILDSEWESDYTLLNIMYTLCVGRMFFRERVVFIAAGPETLRERFQQFLNRQSHPDIISNAEAGAGDTKTQSPRFPVQRCLENRSWHDLAQWWVRGTAVSWETFFQSYAVQRISLPTYCFQKQFFPIPRPARPDLVKDNTNPAAPVESEAPVDDVEIDTAVITRFEAVFAKAIPIPAGQIDLTLPLDQYGFDSVKVLRIAHELEAYFPRVPKTLFFECQTLGDVIDYFTREYPDEARQMLQNPFPAVNIIKHPNKKFHEDPEVPQRQELHPSPLPTPNKKFCRGPGGGFSKEPPGRRRHINIAIIGLAGRYPHAKNIQEFWQNLKAGKDAISEIPPDRWNWRDYFHPHRQEAVKSGKSYSKWGGFIDDVDRFDPLFFNISLREAETMDPQERLFLEVAWEALEDAGYDRTGLKTNRPGKQHMKVGVFVGASWQEYQLFSGMGPGENRTVFSTTANNIANRVSYFFDFKGTSLTVDTACSSSLTAIHLACGSLIQGLDTMVIAGGVNLSVHPNKYISLSGHQVLSGSGRCESFGKGGDGYVPGEGVGAVLLKPLSQAILDGDHIYGVIKATASNHGGKTNGYAVPDPNAQANVIGQALRESGISPRTISYIEAHGTGTPLGDPIEIAGLTKAFREYTRDNRFCAIGSVKSNIGHCESAAGMAGLTKVLLQLKHDCLVPSLHARELNPHIDFSSTPFVVQQELADWKPPQVKLDGETREYPRRAGISAFGAGGANAHLVIEEYIPEKLEPPPIVVTSRNPAIIVLSAKKAEQLREQVRRLLAFIAAADAEQQSGSTALMDMAYTLQVGREPMEERLAVMVGSLQELREKLEGFLEDREGIPGLYLGQVKRNKENIAIFTADEDLQKAMDAWISKGKYGKLLDLWVKGLIFDWDKLYSGSAPYKPRRISLPTYPFARERCWVTGSAPVPGTAEDFEIMTFEETWQEEALPDTSPREIKTLVCFISHPENQQAVVESKLTPAGSTGIIFIARGKTFQKQSPQQYTVCRTDGNTYMEAFKSIRADYGEVDAVLYLWPLEDPDCTRDYSCIVHILQAFASTKLKARRLLLAALFENALDRCYLESWIGFERSSGLVLPHTQVAVVLQAKSAGEQDREATINDWMRKLGKELHTAEVQSVLYQEGKRQVCRIRPTTLQPGRTLIRPGGTYLIIGGSGGLGLLFARHFAETQPVNLILTGRSPLDAEKQSQIKALEASGSRVLYVQAEVCNETSLQQGVSLAKERFGRIHGVIHAAGIQGHNSILEKELQSFQKVLDPKIKGTLVLDKVMGEEPLDFTCYFSSSSAILGDFGSCDYAVANRFQMAYAFYRAEQQRRGQRQGKTIVINWPLWKDGGMGVDDDEKSKMYLGSSGQRFLETKAGTALFDRLLAQTGTQHLVMVGQPARVHRFLGLAQDPASRSISSASPSSGRRGPEAMKGTSLEKCLERDFQEHISRILKISPDKLAPDENLADFGFDSIGLAEFASSLTDYYEIEITPAVFFGYPTIEKLIQYFLSKHGEAMRAFYRGNEPGTAVPTAPGQPGSAKPHQAVNTDNQSIPGPLAPIAVIGMSGRFPGANTIEEFWQNLVQGKSCITGIPADRWDWREYDGDPHREKGKTNCRWGAFMNDIDCFDPLFFEISPKEAELMDPKQRLFLEEAWHALEDAGYMGQRIKGKSCGVYVGVEEGEYGFLVGENGQVNSNQNATLSARIAYTLDLNGPNLALTAACSSGLVAVHQACQALRQGECQMALVGGISLIISPLTYISMSKADMLSPQGKCYVFDRRANGLVPGEAAAVVLLKPLSKAAADNDHIYGVIKASGVNYDGKTNGLTAPNPLRQAELIQTIYDKYLINPANIQYVISHSTGSKLGDPVEIEAFTEAFKKYTDKKQYCTIGSLKSLIGHTFAASGVVSLIGMLKAMKYQTIPGSHYYESANEYIHFQETPFMVNRENQTWPAANNRPRLGVIGTSGISGTNAHAVIEEYLPPGEKPLELPSFTSPQVAVFSAKNPERLQAAARQMLDFLRHESASGLHLPDIAYTLQVGREAMKERLAMVVSSKQELSQKLHAFTSLLPGDFGEHRIFTGSSEAANPGSLESPASGKEDPEKLASLWVNGATVPWEKLHEGQPVKIISLPTYPFKKRRCWLSALPTAYPEEKYKITPHPQNYENKAAELYDLKARDGNIEFKEEYLTFAPFNEKVPGFSMSGVFLYPEKYPRETQLTREKQIEMRQVLFCKEDFREIHTLVDIGCGHGTDVIQIAALYPHVQTYGYTITRAQADLGNQRIARMNLDSRAKIFHKDSSKDAFPGGCDLIIGFEVCCHIGDKHGLFRNMDSALNENGRVLLMDFIANLRGPIADPNIEISISTKQDWIDLLSQYHLVIDEIIDVSPQIANCAYDPYFEQNTKDIPRVMKDSLQNFTNCSMSLQKGWISYCLFRLRKDIGGSDQERRDENAYKISNPTPYPEALKDMLNRGHIPYPGKDHERDTREQGGLPPCGFSDRLPDPGTLKADLQDIFIKVLKLQPGELGEISTFKELGINSINAVELLEAINSQFNLTLPTSIIFECSKIDSLARYIGEHLPETRAIQRTDSASEPGTKFTDLQKNRRQESGDIAIIGLSCRCAGANNQEEFWDIVREGKDCIREIQNREWLDFFQSNSDKKIPARYGRIEDTEFFDPLFFNISPKEAAAMDPTQRILLEEIYKALEDSGYTPSGLNDQPVGTLIGAMGSAPMQQDFSHFSMLGTDTSILASRIAYFLDLKGPALAINTACSSSLVAIDLACQKLKSRDIDLAIAGGVTIYTQPGVFIQMRNAGMLSPTGECRPFDQAANGIVVGDGVGVVILKRLAEAQRDNDYIYGIIRGSGTNQDGQTAGITVPGFLSQSRLEESVYRKNQICVEDFQYIETHGTATKLGDPVEIHALDHCFKKFTSRKRFCRIGSLKANIGHTTAAAGVLSVIKVLLSLKHKQIPPSIHFDKENEHIDFANSAFFVNTSLSQWPTNAKGSRLAAVSSFGFSGTNAHLVIEEYTAAPPETPAQVNETAPGLLVLSAQSQDGLQRYAKKTREFIRAHNGINLADFLHTFQVGRVAMPFRLALVAANQEELIKQLEQFSQNHITKSTKVFTGKVENKADLPPGETEENREFIQKLIRHRELEKLAQLWINGSRIDWEALYPSGTVKRLAGLPTYPFTRERIGVRDGSAPAPIFSNRPGKPREIPLLPLSGDQIPASQPRQSIRLSSTTISLSSPGSSPPPEPVTPVSTAIPTSALEEELKTSLAEALFLKPQDIDPHKRFIDLGMDSIVGVEWVQVINKRYGTSLPATILYDYPTLRDLAGLLASEPGKQEETREISGKETAVNPVTQTRAAASPGEAYRSLLGGDQEAVAIVGMSGRYPDAADLNQYWDNLARAKNSIKEIPGSRWDVNRYYDPRPSQEGKIYCKWLGALEDIEYFDPLFFNISPEEAALMDPQHRLFLLEGYKALEDAGYNYQSLGHNKCGVYLGIASSEYGLMLHQNQAGMADTTGNSFAVAAARISYHLDLKGPAIPIDTACSSSLVAAHLACQALLNREIDMALVGGVSLYLTPESYISMCRAGMLSPDGQCKTFDNHANGFVPGEGVGAVVLKRLKDAQAHGDSIYGVIIGSGINHDGKTNGITAPSVNSQIELEREIYHKYKIDPASIGYVETHGTGTKLGDPVELQALAKVFKEKTSKKNYCALASVKTNIGHTSAAAGIAGIQKVLLSLRHKQLAPTLNVKSYNEYFNFEDSPFYVNTRLQPWNPEPGFPRRAAVSSFGFSGTNAHMVIEEPHGENYNAPVQKKDRGRMTNYKQKTSFSLPGAKNRERSADNMIIFLLSAKSEPQLKTYAERMKRYIECDEDLDLANLSYTLQVGRAAMDHRLALAADSKETLVNALGEFINGNSSPGDLLVALGKTGNDEKKHFEEKKDTAALIQSLMRMKKPKELARLWMKGWNVDWTRLYDGSSPHQPRRISLPTYPFARERCWVPGTAATAGSAAAKPVPAASLHPAPQPNNPEVYHYDEPYLKDHTVNGQQVLTGMTHGSLAINTFFKLFPGETGVHLHQLSFVKPIEVKRDQKVEVLVVPEQHGSIIDFQVKYRYASTDAWDLTAAGKLHKTRFERKKIDIPGIKNSLKEFQWLDHIYTSNPAVELGDSFKIITHLYTGKDRVLARVALGQALREENHRYVLHPLIINSAFMAIAPLLETVHITDGFLPFGIKDIYFQEAIGLENCWVMVKSVKYSSEMITFDADVIDEKFQAAAYYSGCSLKRLRSPNRIWAKDRQISASPGVQQHKPETSNAPSSQTPVNSNPLADKIQKYLTNKLGKIAGLHSTPTDPEVNLMDLGLKSSRLVQLTNDIQKETNIELNPTLFFEYPNIKGLTEFFSREHQGPFKKLLGNSSTPLVDFEPAVQTPVPVNTNSSDGNISGDIAVIGMSGLFADSPDLDKFWIHLRDQSDLIKEIPKDHWDYHPWYEKNPEARDKTYCKWGSFIEDVDKFDADFFNISPREAKWMDPQLRLLLQSVYAAGEDAGYINRLRGTTAGVFVGVCSHDYTDRITELNLPMDPYLGTGNTQTVIANRVSFYFDFTGPSIAIDTACSSSLFALHYACQALRGKECIMAFVSGVNLLLSPVHYRYFSSLGVLSPTGRCHTFDEAADGYVPGECAATILLKPLEQAKRDGDRIHAIIKGSAALHGGYTPSLTAPGVAGEENVIIKAWENAGIHPETLSYLEAHGTGTKLGDPIEVTALKKAFKRYTDKERFCAIGSAKSNIGHTEGAAGIAGVLKVILQMKHRQIPALPQFKKLNPHINLEKSPLYLPRELQEWKSPAGVPRRAGVNSFGFSGAYAHVVLEEYIPDEPEQPPITIDTRNPAIIVLSARNEERLKEQVQRLLAFITSPERQFSDTHLMDMAYTLQVGREAMEERLAVTVTSIEELREKLNAFLEGNENCQDLYRGQVKRNKEALAVFAADEDLQQAIDNWLSKRKYAKLLDLWVKGLTVDWNQLYGDGKTLPYQPRRIGLPTYPFARKRYWLAALEAETGLTTNSPAVPVSSTRSPFAFPAENAAPSTFSSPSAKPSGIPLQSLSDGPISPPSPPPPSTRLSLTKPSISITPPGPNPGPASRDHAPVESLQEELKTSLAKVLYINRSEVVLDKKFIEMGLDSIVCVEWIQGINKQYGTSIAATSVYDYPTLGEFAGFLAKELKVSMTTPKPSPIPVPSLQEELSLSLGRVLSMDQGDINADDEFVEIGLDAVLGMEWLQAINQQYGTSITAASIHDYPTLRQFAGFLEKELNQEKNDLTTASLKTMPSLSLDELIDQVQQGALDCQQADRLFQQLDF